MKTDESDMKYCFTEAGGICYNGKRIIGWKFSSPKDTGEQKSYKRKRVKGCQSESTMCYW